MLEQELEKGWPQWLKSFINEIIKILEKVFTPSCDAFGVWGSRTVNGSLFTSRNLDWTKNTGIDQWKLVTVYGAINSTDPSMSYVTLGFTDGLGCLAGMNGRGVTVSEMNLDNSRVTFDGLPFPLRLRYVLENSQDLTSAMGVWNSTNNTNSFNFLIGSANDLDNPSSAFALETIMKYTAVFGADSPVERDATYYCAPGKCSWTNETGEIHIGKPLPEAIWRTNHAFDPIIMKTQEPLFNDTVFRYNLMHDLFEQFHQSKQLIDAQSAVSITATLGTKGRNFFSCKENNFKGAYGDNIMSVTYAPTPSLSQVLYVAWGSGSDANWSPAACNPYIMIELPWVDPI